MKTIFVRIFGAVLFAAILGWYFSKTTHIDKSTQIEWQQVTLNELSFQSPFKIETDPEPVNYPAEVNELIKEYQQWHAVKSGDVQLAIAKIIYQDKVNVSLEGAAVGSINSMAKGYGDKTPIPNFEAIKNKPYDGLIAVYNPTVSGKKTHVRGAYIVRGQTLYMFIAISPEGSFAENDAFKIFDSIELKAQ